MFSRDVVGSEHFRYSCVNGEVVVEQCGDHRQQICVEDKKTVPNGQEIDNAMCRVNMWEQCISYNEDEGCKTGCLAQCGLNPDCALQEVYVGKDFNFAMCVPKYPLVLI